MLILSVGISVLISSLFITGYFLIKIGEDSHEKDLIHLAGLTDSIEVFLAHATTLNYQLALNTDIKETIVNSEPEWDLRYNNYESLYNTKEDFSENSGIPLLTKMQKEYGFVELFFVQDKLGDQTARSFGPIGRRGERWWYKVITEDKEYKLFLFHSYYSLTGSKPVASVFHPIKENNSFIGIMGMDINFHHLQKLMESYVIAEDMYAIITDMNGVIIAHPDTEKINEIYNLVSMTRSSLAKDDKGILDVNGYQKLIEEPLDWPAEISSAVSLAVKGETGYFENIYFDKKISNLYYSPISLSQAGNSNQNYAVLLVHLQTGLVNSRNIVTFSIFLFIICIISIVYLIFRKQFKKSILIPLEKLIIAMKNIDVEKHNEILIDTDDEFTLLADAYNALCRRLKSTNTQLLDKLEHLKESEAGYKTFSEIGLALSTERNIFRLLELILDESRKLTHADGGTLYLYDKENENLKFEIMHTETMNFYMGGTSEKPITLPPVPMYHDGKPNHSNVCTSAALKGEVINIPDVYEAVGFNFQGMREYDSRNGYHSKSMLVIPMKNMENELIGVIQLINSTIKETKEVIPFSSANQSLTISLASQAAVALTNVQLNKDLENLFHAFIK
ncbi:MAG: GAF domain-containing protein, partial [Deltaproteobacteria bacterium]|nr:GAF domain-containing protein [Deltaproteobacteria bacterium]